MFCCVSDNLYALRFARFRCHVLRRSYSEVAARTARTIKRLRKNMLPFWQWSYSGSLSGGNRSDPNSALLQGTDSGNNTHRLLAACRFAKVGT